MATTTPQRVLVRAWVRPTELRTRLAAGSTRLQPPLWRAADRRHILSAVKNVVPVQAADVLNQTDSNELNSRIRPK